MIWMIWKWFCGCLSANLTHTLPNSPGFDYADSSAIGELNDLLDKIDQLAVCFSNRYDVFQWKWPIFGHFFNGKAFRTFSPVSHNFGVHLEFLERLTSIGLKEFFSDFIGDVVFFSLMIFCTKFSPVSLIDDCAAAFLRQVVSQESCASQNEATKLSATNFEADQIEFVAKWVSLTEVIKEAW